MLLRKINLLDINTTPMISRAGFLVVNYPSVFSNAVFVYSYKGKIFLLV